MMKTMFGLPGLARGHARAARTRKREDACRRALHEMTAIYQTVSCHEYPPAGP